MIDHASAFAALYLTSTDCQASGAYAVRRRHAEGADLCPTLGYIRTGWRGGVECYLWSDSNAPSSSRSAWRVVGPLSDFTGLAVAAMSVVEPDDTAPASEAPATSIVGTTAKAVTRTTPGARVALKPERYRDAAHRVGTVIGLDGDPGRPFPLVVAFDGDPQGNRCVYPADLDLIDDAPAMQPTPCQPQQAKARASKPARGERRYVEVRCDRTGETFRVLTSLATPGAAVIEFIPSNRHRRGELRGMLITHDDITKARVFADGAERNAYMIQGRRMGGNPTYRPASITADPAVA